MEIRKYVYFCARKSITKAGKSKFQDLINAPRTPHFYIVKLGFTGVYIFSYFCSKT